MPEKFFKLFSKKVLTVVLKARIIIIVASDKRKQQKLNSFFGRALWRVVRVVEGARLESVYTANTVSGVRIPDSPPFFYLNALCKEAGSFFRSGHSVWVSRKGIPRTSSGPEGSSDKRIIHCAVRSPEGCGPT